MSSAQTSSIWITAILKKYLGCQFCLKKQFEDIPRTYLFTGDRCRKGFHLSMLNRSLLKAENRKEFLSDEERCLDKFPLTDEQRKCVLKQDYLGMVKAGGNIYYVLKIGATDGKSFQYMVGAMTGVSLEEYRKMMVDGGRSIEGNRSNSEKQ